MFNSADDWEHESYLPERPIRFFQSTGTVELTCRTLHGRFLMKPSDAANELIAGVLAHALRLFPTVQLHGAFFLSNHYTMLATFSDVGLMSAFMNVVNSNLARELGRHYGWPEKFWSRRYRAIELTTASCARNRLKYLLAQGSKEGLVARPADWPGFSSLRALLLGEEAFGIWFDRTKEYRARKANRAYTKYEYAEKLAIPFTPLPGWEDLSSVERQAEVARIVAEIEEEAARTNRELKRRPLGAKKILAQNPHDHPRAPAKSPAPLCHAPSRKEFFAFLESYGAFVATYRAASKRLRAGVLEALHEFPRGCFLPRFPQAAYPP